MVGVAFCLALLASAPAVEAERRTDASVQIVTTRLSEIDETDIGVGVRVSHRLTRWLAADGDLSYFPPDLGDPAFSSSRLEGRLGLRVGPRLGRTGGYVALDGGFVRFAGAPAPVACILALIYPPPLECALASGATIPAVSFSLGAEAFPRDRIVVRLELGDELLRYPGPASRPGRAASEGDFWTANPRLSLGVGVRF